VVFSVVVCSVVVFSVVVCSVVVFSVVVCSVVVRSVVTENKRLLILEVTEVCVLFVSI